MIGVDWCDGSKYNFDRQTDRFKNYISLGYFCEVAKDLEKLGLRNQSSPFDWVISYFPNVINAIDKGVTQWGQALESWNKKEEKPSENFVKDL